MARRQMPQPLNITSSPDSTATPDCDNDPPLSAHSFQSPRSPRSPFRFSSRPGFGENPSSTQLAGQNTYGTTNRHVASPTTEGPAAGHFLAADNRDAADPSRLATSPAKKGFFGGRKTPSHQNDSTMSIDTEHPPHSSSSTGPTQQENGSGTRERSIPGTATASSQGINSFPSAADLSGSPPVSTLYKKNRPKQFSSLLGRTKSIRVGDPVTVNNGLPLATNDQDRFQAGGMRTAPLRADTDRTFRDAMNSTGRNRSADRQHTSLRGNVDREKDAGRQQQQPPAQSHLRESTSGASGTGGSFLHGLKSGGSKAFGVGKGFFGKVGRSYSSNEKEAPLDDEHYVLKVLTLPLIAQTRRTRISKKLEESRDKTEFWMPAFPWRAIDYLNYRGTETEGLYRVPGSGPQIKKWQRRFDEGRSLNIQSSSTELTGAELDIDLFEQEDLYDINIIGSMLKAWLREIDEIFPKASQDRIAATCRDTEEVPQLLIDELSNLPPYNYYLLFAVTCHLSLLLAHSDKNKMDYRNLCICFQPCLKIDAYCFKFLVVDWTACWKGCKTEQYWIDQEYSIFDEAPPSSREGEGRSSTAAESHDERAIESSDSSKPASMNFVSEGGSTPKALSLSNAQGSQSRSSISTTLSTITTTTTTTTSTSGTKQTTEGPRQVQPDLVPLAPIEPLSPINFTG